MPEGLATTVCQFGKDWVEWLPRVHVLMLSKLIFPQLYVITHAPTGSGLTGSRTHEDIVRAAVVGGAKVVQLRDKHAGSHQLIDVARRCGEIVRAASALLLVNDRVDVALAGGAHGVHLGDEDMPIESARELAGDRLLIGGSVATADEARGAVTAGADYVSVGAIFATQTKTDAGAPVGCERLREIKNAVDVPVAAIGGINSCNIESVVEAGADMICVVSAITEANDMAAATRELVGLMGRG